MKEIQLTQGQVQKVDDKDFDELDQHSWYAQWDPHTESFYARRGVRRGGKKTTLCAHREILGLEPGDPRYVHHVNGNTLDNRRENLKVVTPAEHKGLHRNDPRKDASKYGVGVTRTRHGRFRARASIDGKKHNVGNYATPEEAQQARQDFLTNRREDAVCREH